MTLLACDEGEYQNSRSTNADNLMIELTKIRTIGLTDDGQDSILSKTAMDVFKLEEYMKEN